LDFFQLKSLLWLPSGKWNFATRKTHLFTFVVVVFSAKKISIVLNFFFFRNLIPLVWFVAVLMELFLMSCVAKKRKKNKKTLRKRHLE